MKAFLLNKKVFVLMLAILPLSMCSKEESFENIESENNTSPSDDISTLFLTNISRAFYNEHLPLLKNRRAPIERISFYRDGLNIPDSVGILSVSGGSYNLDGSFPMVESETYEIYDSNHLDRNNVTISFFFIDEMFSNAILRINTPFTFERLGGTTIEVGKQVFHRVIETGSFTIKANGDRLNDEIPPLGRDANGNIFREFTFNDEEATFRYNGANLPSVLVNSLRSGVDDLGPIDFNYGNLSNMMGEKNRDIPIRVIETAIVQKGQRLEITQPPNF